MAKPVIDWNEKRRAEDQPRPAVGSFPYPHRTVAEYERPLMMQTKALADQLLMEEARARHR